MIRHALPQVKTSDDADQPLGRMLTLVAWTGMAIALFGSAWFVDPGADASFDAAKRVAIMIGGTIVATALVLGWRLVPSLPAAKWPRRLLMTGALLAAACFASSLAHPFDAPFWRIAAAFLALGLFVATLPVGGVAVPRLWRWSAVAVFVNALISVFQHAGLTLPWSVLRTGGRFDSGALLGNEGSVAMAACLAGSACLAWALVNTSRPKRGWAAIGLLICLATIFLNRQVTSAAAMMVAAVLMITIHARLRGTILVGLFVLGALASLGLYGWARDRASVDTTLTTQSETRVERLERLTTYRLGAHAAALEMLITEPLTGHGPGSYARLSQEYRLRAELRWHTRFNLPPNANAHVLAHQDTLQFAAEFGAPAALLAIVFVLTLMVRMARLARDNTDPETLALLGVLVAGTTLSLAWFPLHVPLTACLLIFAAARSLRLLITPGDKQA
ncbi:MAG: O-antigen ligase family protein [Ahniella sp.]|nr:O-antigen ligase family protein [Ahniella sp.]